MKRSMHVDVHIPSMPGDFPYACMLRYCYMSKPANPSSLHTYVVCIDTSPCYGPYHASRDWADALGLESRLECFSRLPPEL